MSPPGGQCRDGDEQCGELCVFALHPISMLVQLVDLNIRAHGVFKYLTEISGNLTVVVAQLMCRALCSPCGSTGGAWKRT